MWKYDIKWYSLLKSVFICVICGVIVLAKAECRRIFIFNLWLKNTTVYLKLLLILSEDKELLHKLALWWKEAHFWSAVLRRKFAVKFRSDWRWRTLGLIAEKCRNTETLVENRNITWIQKNYILLNNEDITRYNNLF